MNLTRFKIAPFALTALVVLTPLASAQSLQPVLDPGNGIVTLLVDGRAVPQDVSFTKAVTSAPVALPAGTHTVTVVQGGSVLASKTFTVHARQTYVLSAPSDGHSYQVAVDRLANAE